MRAHACVRACTCTYVSACLRIDTLFTISPQLTEAGDQGRVRETHSHLNSLHGGGLRENLTERRAIACVCTAPGYMRVVSSCVHTCTRMRARETHIRARQLLRDKPRKDRITLIARRMLLRCAIARRAKSGLEDRASKSRFAGIPTSILARCADAHNDFICVRGAVFRRKFSTYGCDTIKEVVPKVLSLVRIYCAGSIEPI